MIASTLSKWTLHTLRLYNPGKKGFDQEEWWHAAVAGAVSGVSVVAEKGSRRVTLGQQMLVRYVPALCVEVEASGSRLPAIQWSARILQHGFKPRMGQSPSWRRALVRSRLRTDRTWLPVVLCDV